MKDGLPAQYRLPHHAVKARAQVRHLLVTLVQVLDAKRSGTFSVHEHEVGVVAGLNCAFVRESKTLRCETRGELCDIRWGRSVTCHQHR